MIGVAVFGVLLAGFLPRGDESSIGITPLTILEQDLL